MERRGAIDEASEPPRRHEGAEVAEGRQQEDEPGGRLDVGPGRGARRSCRTGDARDQQGGPEEGRRNGRRDETDAGDAIAAPALDGKPRSCAKLDDEEVEDRKQGSDLAKGVEPEGDGSGRQQHDRLPRRDGAEQGNSHDRRSNGPDLRDEPQDEERLREQQPDQDRPGERGERWGQRIQERKGEERRNRAEHGHDGQLQRTTVPQELEDADPEQHEEREL